MLCQILIFNRFLIYQNLPMGLPMESYHQMLYWKCDQISQCHQIETSLLPEGDPGKVKTCKTCHIVPICHFQEWVMVYRDCIKKQHFVLAVVVCSCQPYLLDGFKLGIMAPKWSSKIKSSGEGEKMKWYCCISGSCWIISRISHDHNEQHFWGAQKFSKKS